jgi:hypothetical protein
MRRLQLFEFSDLPWWPRRLRFLLTGYLQQVTQLADPFARHEALIAEVMQASRSSRIVDLCSGSRRAVASAASPAGGAAGQADLGAVDRPVPRPGRRRADG